MSEKILSVFVDESGDFGSYEVHAPYYLVAMVLHKQNIDISHNIKVFDSHVSNLGYQNHAIHTGPLIRRESAYHNNLLEEFLHTRIFLSYIKEKDHKGAKNEKRTKKPFPEKGSCRVSCPFADDDAAGRLREIGRG